MNIPTPNRGQIFAEISLERLAQDTKHGIQDLPIRPDDPEVQERIRNMAEGFKKLCDRATERAIRWQERECPVLPGECGNCHKCARLSAAIKGALHE